MSLGFFPQLNIHPKHFVLHSGILNSVTGVVSHKETVTVLTAFQIFILLKIKKLLESFHYRTCVYHDACSG